MKIEKQYDLTKYTKPTQTIDMSGDVTETYIDEDFVAVRKNLLLNILERLDKIEKRLGLTEDSAIEHGFEKALSEALYSDSQIIKFNIDTLHTDVVTLAAYKKINEVERKHMTLCIQEIERNIKNIKKEIKANK